jgi:hypothetical protein
MRQGYHEWIGSENKTIRTKMGMKKAILQEIEEQLCQANGRLQNGTHKGKGSTADHTTHKRLGLGTAYK